MASTPTTGHPLSRQAPHMVKGTPHGGRHASDPLASVCPAHDRRRGTGLLGPLLRAGWASGLWGGRWGLQTVCSPLGLGKWGTALSRGPAAFPAQGVSVWQGAFVLLVTRFVTRFAPAPTHKGASVSWGDLCPGCSAHSGPRWGGSVLRTVGPGARAPFMMIPGVEGWGSPSLPPRLRLGVSMAPARWGLLSRRD